MKLVYFYNMNWINNLFRKNTISEKAEEMSKNMVMITFMIFPFFILIELKGSDIINFD